MQTENTATESPPRRKTGGVAGDQLKSIIERVERFEEEKAGLASS